jgi:hypothetical protein
VALEGHTVEQVGRPVLAKLGHGTVAAMEATRACVYWGCLCVRGYDTNDPARKLERV